MDRIWKVGQHKVEQSHFIDPTASDLSRILRRFSSPYMARAMASSDCVTGYAAPAARSASAARKFSFDIKHHKDIRSHQSLTVWGGPYLMRAAFVIGMPGRDW